MKLKFKNITIRNFLSVGNKVESINFDQDGFTLILGENLDLGGSEAGCKNGVGKSSVFQALSYVLYGNALTKIKADKLINNINSKNMLVTLSFSVDDIEYRIERGRKPNIFKFYINDVEQKETNDSQGESKDTQEEVEKTIQLSHLMFKYIICLNTFHKPFLELPTGDQREIIEELLGITILSQKAEKLKEQIKENKDLLTKETATIEATQRANEKIQQSVNNLISSQKAWKLKQKQDIESIIDSINNLKSINIEKEIETHSLLKIYNDNISKLNYLNKQKDTLESSLTQADITVKKLEKDIEITSNSKCPTCDQKLHGNKLDELISDNTEKLNKATSYLNDICEKIENIYIDIDNIGSIGIKPTTLYRTIEEALSHQNNLSNLQHKLEYKKSETDPYQDQIDSLKQTAIQEIDYTTINELTKLKEHQDFLLKLLTNKDSFIRKKIIEQNLNYLNNRLSHYLDKTGLPHQIVFQNDLSVEISHLGHELDFYNLSRGEMTRLTLALSFTFRDLYENLYHSINILAVDELLDNGTDLAGIENSTTILKNFSYERSKNVFLISHRDELIGKANNILKVTKENGFTSYQLESQ